MAVTVSKAPQVNKSKWNIDFIFVGHFKKIGTGLIEKNDRLFLNLLRKAKSGLGVFFFSATMKNLFTVLLVILVFREDVLGRSVDKNKDKDKKDKDKEDKGGSYYLSVISL